MKLLTLCNESFTDFVGYKERICERAELSLNENSGVSSGVEWILTNLIGHNFHMLDRYVCDWLHLNAAKTRFKAVGYQQVRVRQKGRYCHIKW